ncbi:MAG: cysteine desulfurase family protein [Candidatus Aminicenantia bacterium]
MIYLDNNATTPLDPRVKEKIESVLDNFGNPSSLYPLGKKAREMIEEAREEVANLIGAKREEIFFTSSGSEANNWAIKGVLSANPDKKTVLVSSIEHPSTIDLCNYLEKRFKNIIYIPVNRYGEVDIEFIEKNADSSTAVISVMHANNEIGTIQPIKEISKVSRKKSLIFHCDAVQTIGKIKVNVEELGLDLLSGSAHKIYGPKGVGFLYIRKGTKIDPIIHGEQEGKIRGGTENVLGIVGLGEAVKIIKEEFSEYQKKIKELSMELIDGLKKIEGIHFNGHPEKRIDSTISISIEGIDGEALLMALATKDIYVSTGSACSEGKEGPSHVLKAIGLSEELSESTIRISIGRFNTHNCIREFLSVFEKMVKELRAIS